MSKECFNCKIILPFTKFNKLITENDGYQKICKKCYTEERKNVNYKVLEKICTKCFKNKDILQFGVLKHSKDGKHSHCMECRSLSRKKLNYDVNITDKICLKCNIKKDITKFHKDKSSTNGVQTYCIDCQKQISIKYYINGGKELFFKKLFKDLKNNAIKRNIEVNINLQDIINVFESQNGKCNLSGIDLTTLYIPGSGKWNNIHNASIDRINSKKGYYPDNIQIICSMINIMKWDLDQDDFIKLCQTINNFHISKEKK
jgi:hypothetical protein